jgi:conjugative transfer signal peptidase TraF
MVRRLAIGIVSLFLLLCVSIAVGLRFNGTQSIPMGVYWVVGKRPQKGDLVFIDLPRTPIFAMAKERGYLDVAFSPAQHLLKRLVAIAGDRVTINSAGVEVNGARLANSAPMTKDAAGRPLRFYPLQNYVLGPDEALVMSDYSSTSFDARYFGPMKATTMESVVIPILTW